MGYLLSSLGTLPLDDDVSLYIFVINGSWRGGATEAIERNFEILAREIGPSAVIAKGLEERFWSAAIMKQYLGRDYSDLTEFLPALLITDAHPEQLADTSLRLLVPLRDAEKRFGDFESFFRELAVFARRRDPAFLTKFEDRENLTDKALDVLELKPNFFGIGVNVNALIARLRRSNKT